jgi:hypothetical protein
LPTNSVREPARATTCSGRVEKRVSE